VLLKVDPTSGNTQVFHIPDTTDLSQGFDRWPSTDQTSLYIRTSDAAVSQIDPSDGRVIATYPADPAGGGGHEAVGFGSLWVANVGTSTLWRDRLSG
jgi:hypothetical protein